MCDLEHCEHLIRTYEASAGTPFDYVSRIRLDIAWEAELPVPTSLDAPLTVHVPHMNGQGGTNDKFVVGTRDAMSAYLNRTSYFFHNASFYAWLARSSHGQPFAFDCRGNPGSSSGAPRSPRALPSRPSAVATTASSSQPAAHPAAPCVAPPPHCRGRRHGDQQRYPRPRRRSTRGMRGCHRRAACPPALVAQGCRAHRGRSSMWRRAARRRTGAWCR